LPDSATSADAVDSPVDRFWLDRKIKLNTMGKQINASEFGSRGQVNVILD